MSDMESNKDVSIVRCKEYDSQMLDNAVEEHFVNLNLDQYFSADTKVLLKPNLLIRRKPDEVTTTHPEVLGAIVRSLKKRGVFNITLADSCGGLYNSTVLKSLYNGTGMEAMAKREEITLNLETGYREVEFLAGKRCKHFTIIDPVLDSDVIINVGKLKTHSMTGMSGAIKNMFGSIPGLMKPELHCRFPDKSDFAEMLVDLCECTKPTISFIDGIWGMEGDGPSGGEPKFSGVLLAGANPFYLDVVACHIMGIIPKDIPMMNHAITRGLCVDNVKKINIKGVNVDDVVTKFKKPRSKSTDFTMYVPRFMRGVVAKIVTPKPFIVRKDCIGCGKCAESCPNHVIMIKDKKAFIDYDKCIKCYCCHEMCPVKAITIKRFKPFNL